MKRILTHTVILENGQMFGINKEELLKIKEDFISNCKYNISSIKSTSWFQENESKASAYLMIDINQISAIIPI